MSHQPNLFDSLLTCEDALQLSQQYTPLRLSAEASKRMQLCRDFLDGRVEQGGKPIYGVNTGFGSLCNTVIAESELEELQRNLLMSHACGMGERVPHEIVRLMILLKVKGVSFGLSGVQVETAERLLHLLSTNALPPVYTQGSLGASGDLAPLAHLSLPLLGLGELEWNGKMIPADQWLAEQGLQPLRLKSKEGLALINGTQFMSAYASWCVAESTRLLRWANHIAAISLDAFDGLTDPFHPEVHQARPHPGQISVAAEMRELLKGSEIASRDKIQVQDPYSFRCIPQVHGASRDALDYVRMVVEREINAVTDNPMVFPESNEVVSAGNFHGQPLALALDHLAIAVAEIASISERRTYKLISGTRGLPAFLTDSPGLHSGLMIPQYTAASIVSQNKQLCTPASVDTIDSSNGQEDHVSMGANAATKAYKVVVNARRVLSIELFTAAQAIRYRRPARSSEALEALLEAYYAAVNYSGKDEFLHPLMQASEEFVANYNV